MRSKNEKKEEGRKRRLNQTGRRNKLKKKIEREIKRKWKKI